MKHNYTALILNLTKENDVKLIHLKAESKLKAEDLIRNKLDMLDYIIILNERELKSLCIELDKIR